MAKAPKYESHTKPIGISLPVEVIEEIDRRCGPDVARSRWILRAIEAAFKRSKNA